MLGQQARGSSVWSTLQYSSTLSTWGTASFQCVYTLFSFWSCKRVDSIPNLSLYTWQGNVNFSKHLFILCNLMSLDAATVGIYIFRYVDSIFARWLFSWLEDYSWYLKCRLALLEYLGGSCSFSLQIIFLWNLNPFVFTMSQDPCNPVQLCRVGQMWHTTKLWNSIPWEQMSHTVLHKAVLHMKLWEWVSSTLILALSSPFLMHCFVQ